MLRPTTEADVDALVEIARATGVFHEQELDTVIEVYDEYFFIEHEKGHLSFTWEEAGKILGFVYVAPACLAVGTWELWWIAVSPETQGKGIGREMMHRAESLVRKNKGRQIYIDTSSAPQYAKTREFYLRLGYQEAARLPDFYHLGDDKVIYRKLTN